MERVIITGGAGFVGSQLVRQIQQDHPDCEILVIDDFRNGTFANLASEGEDGFAYRGEIIARPLHELDLFQICDDFDPQAIFHEASITDTTVTDQAKMIVENVEPFEELLNVAVDRDIRLVWASSAATYGTRANGAVRQKRAFALEDAGQPANVYGFSKWIMENLHRATQRNHPEVHLVGLRYFNVFGPGEGHKGKMASMIYQLALKMMDGQPPAIFTDGTQARDHIYVQDVVGCTLAGARPQANSGIYNCGTGKATSFNQIIDALNEALGTALPATYFDNPYAFYQDYTCADISRTRRGLDWSPRFSTVEGVTDYVGWLKRQVAGHG